MARDTKASSRRLAKQQSDRRLPSTDHEPFAETLLFTSEPIGGIRLKHTRTTYHFDDFTVNGQAQWVITIGRDETNDIVLSHPSISRFHCALESHQGFWALKDTTSRNGTVIYRAQDRIAQTVEGDAIFVLSLNMRILLPGGFELLPVTKEDRIGLFATTQTDFRVAALFAYEHGREASKKIGCSRSTIYNARKIHKLRNHR